MTHAATGRLRAPLDDQVELVDLPPAAYLAVDGTGDPNTAPAHAEAVQALFAAAYTLRFALRRDGVDARVGPLEGLWASDGPLAFDAAGRERWSWTMMIGQPMQVTARMVEEAVADAGRRRRLPALARLRLQTLHEGLAAQVLHVGPYSEELPTIERLHRFIDEQG